MGETDDAIWEKIKALFVHGKKIRVEHNTIGFYYKLSGGGTQNIASIWRYKSNRVRVFDDFTSINDKFGLAEAYDQALMLANRPSPTLPAEYVYPRCSSRPSGKRCDLVELRPNKRSTVRYLCCEQYGVRREGGRGEIIYAGQACGWVGAPEIYSLAAFVAAFPRD
jgi:hypothetical protein